MSIGNGPVSSLGAWNPKIRGSHDPRETLGPCQPALQQILKSERRGSYNSSSGSDHNPSVTTVPSEEAAVLVTTSPGRILSSSPTALAGNQGGLTRHQERLRDASMQCGHVYYDYLHTHDIPRPDCPDFYNKIRAGHTIDDKFIPGEGCLVKWYSSDEAGHVFGRFRKVVFIGDSITRHFVQTIISHIVGNYRHGALQWWTYGNEEELIQCECLHQYDDTRDSCYKRTMSWYQGPGSVIHPSWDPHQRKYLFAQNPREVNQDLTFLDGALGEASGEEETMVWVLVGLHQNLQFEVTQERYYDDISSVVAKERARRPQGKTHLIFSSIHSPHITNPQEAINDETTKAFNERIRDYAISHGGVMFDTFTVTHGASFHEGTHHNGPVNLSLVQLFLNFLEQEVLI